MIECFPELGVADRLTSSVSRPRGSEVAMPKFLIRLEQLLADMLQLYDVLDVVMVAGMGTFEQ